MTELVKEWLHKADKDFNVAQQLLVADNPDSYDLICFLCQQSIEKRMKALLIFYGQVFPKTHNLEDLGRILTQVDPDFKFNSDDLLYLSRGAVEFRYPGEDAEKEEAVIAFEICEKFSKQLTHKLTF